LSRAGAPSRSPRSAQPGRPPSLASAAAFPDDEPRGLAGGFEEDEDEEEDEEGESGGDKEMLGRLIVGELAARPDEGKRPGNLSLPFCSIISWTRVASFVLLWAPKEIKLNWLVEIMPKIQIFGAKHV
jgi:hypothetical protein